MIKRIFFETYSNETWKIVILSVWAIIEFIEEGFWKFLKPFSGKTTILTTNYALPRK